MNERRKYRRLDIGVRFIYKVMGVKGERHLFTLDLGGGGMRFYIQEKLKIGTLLELGMQLSREDELFFALAKVAWQKPSEKKTPDGKSVFETGAEFVSIDINHRVRLVKFIQEKLHFKRTHET